MSPGRGRHERRAGHPQSAQAATAGAPIWPDKVRKTGDLDPLNRGTRSSGNPDLPGPWTNAEKISEISAQRLPDETADRENFAVFGGLPA